MINGTKEMNDFRDDDDARFLIVKRGLYYRPNAAGYTGVKAEAGRYTEDDARSSSHPNGPSGSRDGMSYVHEDKAPDYSPSCCIHAKADHQNTRIAALGAEVARLTHDLDQYRYIAGVESDRADRLTRERDEARDRALAQAEAAARNSFEGAEAAASIRALRSTSPAPSEAVRERVARAIFDGSTFWGSWDKQPEANRDVCFSMADAALRALASEGDAP